MKIVYILKSFALTAGVERVMADKMNWLANAGYELMLITYEQGNHPWAFQLHSSVRHIDLNTRFFELDKKSLIKKFFLLRQMRKTFRFHLQALIDEFKPDLIIFTTYSIKLVDIILTIRSNAYKIIESHVACYTIKKSYDYRHNIVLRSIAKLYDNTMLNKAANADCLVTLTNGDAADWNHYVSNTIVIPNPVTHIPQDILHHNGSGRRIICVGRLHEQKGFDLLINSFKLIADRCPDWIIDIYGDGPDKAKLLSTIQEKNLQERIFLKTPTPNIYNEYLHSEFLVLSSRYEGYPLVLNEAMSCGIPCVAFRCKYGPEDAIEDGVNGLLAENGNIDDLANKILWMIMHTEERLRMGIRARETSLNYDIQSIMNKWTDLFDRIVR